jgi:hypothetical protein
MSSLDDGFAVPNNFRFAVPNNSQQLPSRDPEPQLRLYEGSIKAPLRLYYGYITALLRLSY